MTVNDVGVEGMKIDRMYFDKFEDVVKEDAQIKEMVQQKDFDAIEQYILSNIFEKPNEYYNINKLRNAMKIDRRLSLREIIEKYLVSFLTSKAKMNCWKMNLKNLIVGICQQMNISLLPKTISKAT
jgi:type I restriction enzyme R subunit